MNTLLLYIDIYVYAYIYKYYTVTITERLVSTPIGKKKYINIVLISKQNLHQTFDFFVFVWR